MRVNQANKSPVEKDIVNGERQKKLEKFRLGKAGQQAAVDKPYEKERGISPGEQCGGKIPGTGRGSREHRP